MKNLFIAVILLFATAIPSFAHYMWIESNPIGTIDQSQEVKVFFGEYTYGLEEKVGEETFNRVQNFTLWVVTPSGNKIQLTTTAKETYYLSSFVPKEKGTYTLLMNNDNIEVIDYTKYDFGIFKTHYHAVTKIQVGEVGSETIAQNANGITIKKLADLDNKVVLQVLYKDQPLAENELKVFVADEWAKTLYTDENGKVTFALPWKTKYLIETTKKEEVSGTYKGADYQFIWHCATISLLP